MIITRLLSFVLLGIILSFSLLFFFVTTRETSVIEKAVIDKAAIYAASITSALKKSMVQGVPTITRDIVNEQNLREMMKVSIFHPNGSLAFGETGVNIPFQHFKMPKAELLRQDNSLIFLSPLLNEKDCYGCHSMDNRVLGFIAVKMPLHSITSGLEVSGRHLVLFGILLFFSSGIAVYTAIKKMILTPLMEIHHGVEIFSKGDLSHRISLRKNDELGALASMSNLMAEDLQKSRAHMETAIRQKTTELRVIAELSIEVFRGDTGLQEIIQQFLHSITSRMDFSYSAVGLVDRETGLLSQEYNDGIEDGFNSLGISLADEHPFMKIVREAKATIKKYSDIGAPESFSNCAIIPILSHQRKRCREIKLCAHDQCPAFTHDDDRCWLMSHTLCRSLQSIAGGNKILGCLRCDAFPVLGVLIAGRKGEISKSSLSSLKILGGVIASAIENQKLIETKKEDIRDLIRLHDISVESLQDLKGPLTASVVSSATLFANMEAAVLWLREDDNLLHLKDTYPISRELVPSSFPIDGSFIGKAIIENRPVETINTEELLSFRELLKQHNFRYAASVPLRFKNSFFGCLTFFKKNDFVMTDSERAVVLLFASQAAAAINAAGIYNSLKNEKEFSETIFNSAASGVLVLDREGFILKINRQGKEILWLETSELTGMRITEIFPETEVMLQTDEKVSREMSLTLKNGSPIPLGFNSSPLYGSQGIIVIFRNLTEIKKLQLELKKKEHFETIGKVISGVAHEIRNPLFGISSIGQILERETESPQHLALIQAMLKETHRMKRLIEELLLCTRPARLNLADISLRHLWEELLLISTAKSNSLTFSLDMPTDFILRADRDKIIQVFLNLLNNAIEAARSAVSISAVLLNGEVLIKIVDDGAGIMPEYLDRIYEPFFTTKNRGTGLGLPICKKIVEDHGGEIQIKSIEGQGTVAVLTFKC